MIFWLIASALAADLAALERETLAYPQDYGVAAAYASALCAAQPGEPCAAAWEKAGELSGWGAEAAWAYGLAVEAQRPLARAHAARITQLHQDEAWSWLYAARVRRSAPGPWSSWWRASRSAGAVKRAAHLAPDDPEVRCARAWNRALLDDETGAAAAAVGASADCGVPTPPPQATYTASAYLSGIAEVSGGEAAWKPVSLAGASWRPAWGSVGVNLRYIPGEKGSNGIGRGANQGYPAWTELWLNATTSAGPRGASAHAAGVSGSATALLAGAQAWGRAGAVWRGAAVMGRWSDGDSLQLNAGARLPLFTAFTADFSIERTRHTDAEGLTAEGLQTVAFVEGYHGARALRATLRTGHAMRPVRLDEPTVWWYARPLGPAAALTLTWPTKAGDLFFGYEALTLPETPDEAAAWVHTLSVGANTPSSRRKP